MSPTDSPEPGTPGTGPAAIATAAERGRRLRRWRVALVPVALMSPLAMVACGSEDSAQAAAGQSSGEGTSDQNADGQGGPDMAGMQEYMSCLTDNGVTLPDAGEGGMGQPPEGADGERPEPPADGEAPQGADGEMPEPPADGEMSQGGPGGGAMFGLDTSDATVAAAIEACADLAPEMPQGGPGGQQGQGQQNQQGQDQQDDGSTTSTTVATS